MGRQLHVEWQEEEKTLYKLYKQQTDSQDRSRMQALWLLRQGHTLQAVADIIGIHYRTLRRWVDCYRHGGLAVVLSRRQGAKGGLESRLCAAQEQELVEKAAAGELRSIRAGVEWAKEVHGIHYSYWGMRHVYQRLNLNKKVPRPRAPKASQALQTNWKKGD
jgi:transposase